MQRVISDAMITAGSAMALALALVLFDERVREQPAPGTVPPPPAGSSPPEGRPARHGGRGARPDADDPRVRRTDATSPPERGRPAEVDGRPPTRRRARRLQSRPLRRTDCRLSRGSGNRTRTQAIR